MTKSELVTRLSKRFPNLLQRDLENLVNIFLEEISSALESGGRVELRGFGAFSVKERDGRTGRNPRTGESIDVTPKRVQFFKTGKELRAGLNTKA